MILVLALRGRSMPNVRNKKMGIIENYIMNILAAAP
jgi:hypothetical protein